MDILQSKKLDKGNETQWKGANLVEGLHHEQSLLDFGFRVQQRRGGVALELAGEGVAHAKLEVSRRDVVVAAIPSCPRYIACPREEADAVEKLLQTYLVHRVARRGESEESTVLG